MADDILDRVDVSSDDMDFVVANSGPKRTMDHIDRAALAMAMARGARKDVGGSREAMAREINKLALKQKNDEDRRRLVGIAQKFELPVHAGKAVTSRYDRTMRKERMERMVQGAKTQHEMASGLKGGRPMIAPEDRERFERLLGNRPPQRATAPSPAPQKPAEKTKPTTREQIVAVAQRRAVRRQIAKAQKPAPRKNVKLHVKKSALPKLSKGRNVKLQVPSSDLPQTQRLRTVLKGR